GIPGRMGAIRWTAAGRSRDRWARTMVHAGGDPDHGRSLRLRTGDPAVARGRSRFAQSRRIRLAGRFAAASRARPAGCGGTGAGYRAAGRRRTDAQESVANEPE